MKQSPFRFLPSYCVKNLWSCESGIFVIVDKFVKLVRMRAEQDKEIKSLSREIKTLQTEKEALLTHQVWINLTLDEQPAGKITRLSGACRWFLIHCQGYNMNIYYIIFVYEM